MYKTIKPLFTQTIELKPMKDNFGGIYPIQKHIRFGDNLRIRDRDTGILYTRSEFFALHPELRRPAPVPIKPKESLAPIPKKPTLSKR